MRYQPDSAGLAAYVRSSPELKAEMMRRARVGLGVAQAMAPRLQTPRRDRVPGALAASGHIVDDGVQPVKNGNPRMQLSILFDVFYAVNVTFDQRRAQAITTAYLNAAKAAIEAGG